MRCTGSGFRFDITSNAAAKGGWVSGIWDETEPLAPPDALDPFVVDDPASRRSQKLCDLPIAIAAVPAGEFNNVGGQPLLVLSSRRGSPFRPQAESLQLEGELL